MKQLCSHAYKQTYTLSQVDGINWSQITLLRTKAKFFTKKMYQKKKYSSAASQQDLNKKRQLNI